MAFKDDLKHGWNIDFEDGYKEFGHNDERFGFDEYPITEEDYNITKYNRF